MAAHDDSNPIARQLSGQGLPPRPKGGNVRRRVPLFRRRWFVVLTILFLTTSVTVLAVVMAFLKPLREQAETFDLDGLHNLEKASIIYDRKGDELGRIYVLNRIPVSIEQVPMHFIQALTSQEDERFFQHSGVDMWGVLRAIWLNYKAGEETQGASTITQQLAREAFKLKELEKTGAKNARYERKIVEWFLAERIETKYNKTEILELYLNRIFFGRQFNGIQAAAKGYFGKDVKDLTLEESALIAGIIKSPNNLEPIRWPERAKKARDHVFDRMHQEGYLSSGEVEELKNKPVETAPQGDNARLSYVYDEIRQEVASIIGEEAAQIGGFHIYTTVDGKLQKAAEAALRKQLDKVEQQPGYPHQTYVGYHKDIDALKQRIAAKTVPVNTPKPNPQYLQGAVLAIDNHDGSVLAMVGGRDFLDSMYNRAVQSRRPAGTAFIPFVYASAFETPDYFPPQQIEDGPLDLRRVMIGGFNGIIGEWGAERLDKITYSTSISARESLLQGRNAATVRLGEKVGLDKVLDMAKRAGFKDPINAPSTFLGATEVRLDEMCLAYSAFANKGRRPAALTLIHRITDTTGKVIYQVKEDEDAQHVQVMDNVAAYQVHSCLTDALQRGTGAPAYSEYGLAKFPAAGKTGTHYEFKDLWFVGYSSAVTCGVWCGFDQQKSIYDGAFSNRVALPIWVDVMNASIKDYKPEEFSVPSAQDVQAVEVCKKSGKRATDACYEKVPDPINGGMKAVRSTYQELLRPESMFDLFCDVHRGSSITADLLSLRSSDDRGGASAVPVNPLVANVPPVRMKGLTVIGSDPYGTEQPVLRAEPVNEDGTAVLRAVPVEEEGTAQAPIKLAPPPPLKLD